jgi:hypothetical protein
MPENTGVTAKELSVAIQNKCVVFILRSGEFTRNDPQGVMGTGK